MAVESRIRTVHLPNDGIGYQSRKTSDKSVVERGATDVRHLDSPKFLGVRGKVL